MVGSERYLGGKLLIAMPDMADPRFRRSVIYMLAHTDQEAMGIVVNKIAGSISQTGGKDDEKRLTLPLHDGGPVDPEQVIVIHSGDGSEYPSTHVVADNFCVTATPDIIDDLSRGEGPRERIIVVSYAGWSAGQLESELERHAWLVCDATSELVFRTEPQSMWDAAIKSLGFSAGMLAAGGGTA